MKLKLPKFNAWSHQLDTVINIKAVVCKLLQSITGILETMELFIFMGANFINNVMVLEIKSGKTHHTVHIPNQVKEDLKLWKKILKIALEVLE